MLPLPASRKALCRPGPAAQILPDEDGERPRLEIEKFLSGEAENIAICRVDED
jgi:hypothetical protein